MSSPEPLPVADRSSETPEQWWDRVQAEHGPPPPEYVKRIKGVVRAAARKQHTPSQQTKAAPAAGEGSR